MTNKFFRDLIIAIIGGAIAGLIVGVILYSLYNSSPELYVSCSQEKENIMIVEIENGGKPAIDVFIGFTQIKDGMEWGLHLKSEIMIGKEKFKTMIDVEDLKKRVGENPFELHIGCKNCKEEKIIYGDTCSYDWINLFFM